MNAEQIVKEAIAEYGRPAWVANVTQAVREQVDKETLRNLLEGASKSPESFKVKDKYDALLDYAAENMFEEITTKKMKELTGLSGPAIRRWLDGHTDTFRKVKNGTWEIRDAAADRKADKAL